MSLKQDYDRLQSQYNKINITLAQSTNPESAQIKAPNCTSGLISAPNFSKNFTLPAVCPGCQSLIDNGIKNAKNGKVVSVTETRVKQAVYGSTGTQIQNVALSILPNDGSNLPGGKNTSPSGTGASQPAASKKGVAGRLERSAWMWMCLLVGCVLF